MTRAVNDALRADERLRDVWVEGEVGRVTVSTAGHGYFSLQDERSQLACVFFRDDRVASPFQPQSGLRVVAHGRVDVFDSQGVYQLYVTSLQPAGFGDLALRFEALKAKLPPKGCSTARASGRCPFARRVVAVVTSPTGAVWHDIRNVLTRRWPLTRVLLVPCLVQGDTAPASIVAALDRLGRWVERAEREGRAGDAPAVTILARGGGSLEDLWPFNDEAVVRAVVRHPVPVVCGVGHEVDVTLADFAADVRAPTPSAAAELVTPDRFELAAALRGRRPAARCDVGGRLDARPREAGGRTPAARSAEPDRAARRSPASGPGCSWSGDARDRAGRRRRVASHRRARRAARADRAGPPRARLATRLDRAVGVLPLLVRARLAARVSRRSSAAGAALGVLGPAGDPRSRLRDRPPRRRRCDRPGPGGGARPAIALRIRVARGEVRGDGAADVLVELG